MRKRSKMKTLTLALGIGALMLSVRTPFTAYAAEKTASWASNDKGWWIQYSDGTYLIDSWYQSPDSGLWYYMGLDGYMLVNTTTPDGYAVNADGVRQEPSGGSSSQSSKPSGGGSSKTKPSGGSGSSNSSKDSGSQNSDTGSSGTKPLPPIAPAQGGDRTGDGFGPGWG